MRKVYFTGDRAKRFTMIAACDIDGFIYESCEIIFQAGTNDTDPSHGTIDAERFRIWVKEKLVPTLGKYHLSKPHSIVVMDNATVHANVKDLIESAGAKLIYLSAYSPELNPIELMFGMYKAYLKRHLEVPFYMAHNNALQCVSPDIARALFKHSKVPLCENFPSQAELMLEEQQNEVVATAVVVSCFALLLLVLIANNDVDDNNNNE